MHINSLSLPDQEGTRTLSAYTDRMKGLGKEALKAIKATAADLSSKIQEALPSKKTIKAAALVPVFLAMTATDADAQLYNIGWTTGGGQNQITSSVTGLMDRTRNPSLGLGLGFYNGVDSTGTEQNYIGDLTVRAGLENTELSHTTYIGNVEFIPGFGILGKAPCNDFVNGDFDEAQIGAYLSAKVNYNLGNSNSYIGVHAMQDVFGNRTGVKFGTHLGGHFGTEF